MEIPSSSSQLVKRDWVLIMLPVCMITQALSLHILKLLLMSLSFSIRKRLMGTSAHSLPGIDITVMREGPRLSANARQSLVQPVTHQERGQAMFNIDPNKAPGVDGFNAFFFQRVWHIVKRDIYEAVFEFFSTGSMSSKVNCTSVTLIPKIQNACEAKHFRPIACCTVCYKIIAKILTARLQKVVGEVVDGAQAGFIPGRHLADNIFLATELLKGYTRKAISPRCMLKVDLQKAYDSVEWPFLQSVLEELGFPAVFISWIMGCITSVSYSLLINGHPTTPFAAKKGLRQGDPMSPFLFALGMEYFTRCLKTMVINPQFNFHPRCEKLVISHLMFADDLLMFARGD